MTNKKIKKVVKFMSEHVEEITAYLDKIQNKLKGEDKNA